MPEIKSIQPVDHPHIEVNVVVPAGLLPETPILAVVAPTAPPVTALTKITPTRLAVFLDKYAAPEWRVAHLLWSVRLSIFWAIFGGLWVALPAFQNYLPAFWFAMICVGFSLAILFARFTNQKGLPV